MSTTIVNGGPAFPSQPIMRMPESTQMVINQGGMFLRDYFAAKAMHALLVADGTVHFPNRAKEAYEMADAMLVARGEP